MEAVRAAPTNGLSVAAQQGGENMVRLKRVLESLVRRVENWGAERGDLFSNLPDNPWTYPGCGVHVKASDFFSGGNDLWNSVSVSVPNSDD